MNMNFYVGTKIITGIGCVKKSADEFKRFGKKCIIVTGKSSAEKCGALGDVKYALDSIGTEYIIYSGISQNPTVVSCFEAAEKAIEFGAEYVIGIGGGSPLDASKAVAVAIANPKISEKDLYAMNWANTPLKVIAVGTTAGTGSEVTSVSVLTNSEGRKKSFRNDLTYPALSLGDPVYTTFMSDNFTRSTAVDALAHCTESYFNRRANDISRSFAAEGIRKLIKVFRKIAESGTESLTLDDREELYNASLYGGFAISVTGTAFPHALGYFLTENYGIPHGTACAVFLNEFMAYNAECEPQQTEDFYIRIGCEKEEFAALIDKITPETDIKLSDGDIAALSPRWVGNASLAKNYGNVDADFVNKLLRRLF